MHSGDLARLRLSLRQRCGFSRASGIADAAVHFVRKASYLALRLAGRVMPGAVPPKRWPWAGGVVVALVAPDGLGKSTQVSLLTRIFRWKFGCAQVYVGTGEGRGWRLRKGLQRLAFYRRRELKAMIRTEGRESRAMGRILSVGLALWGVLIAIERYAVVNRAHRWAMRGMIVISDRWPQKLRHGYLDGPMIPPNLSSAPGVGMLARLEKKLYERMDSCRPHLTLHLVSDYSVSEARKPGEITREGSTRGWHSWPNCGPWTRTSGPSTPALALRVSSGSSSRRSGSPCRRLRRFAKTPHEMQRARAHRSSLFRDENDPLQSRAAAHS